jgi:uncharacterized protein YraI
MVTSINEEYSSFTFSCYRNKRNEKMKTKYFTLAIATASLISITLPSTTRAAEAYSISNLNLRAGPGGDYPIVGSISRGQSLDLLGCIDKLSWCEVEAWGQERGWVSANFIETSYKDHRKGIRETYDLGVIQIVTFSLDDYWGKNYRDRDFYKSRKNYYPASRPLEPQQQVSHPPQQRGKNPHATRPQTQPQQSRQPQRNVMPNDRWER